MVRALPIKRQVFQLQVYMHFNILIYSNNKLLSTTQKYEARMEERKKLSNYIGVAEYDVYSVQGLRFGPIRMAIQSRPLQ